MEPPEPTSAKLKLWRWLLLLSVITIALGGLVLWNSRRERLQFVEPIWADSLEGHENHSAATGKRRKIGEVWSLSRYRGLSLFGRGDSRDFEGRYPVFTELGPLHSTLSAQLLFELREWEEFNIASGWSNLWSSIRSGGDAVREDVDIQVLFCTDEAVTLRKRNSVSTKDGGWNSVGGRTYLKRNGKWHFLNRDELFDGKDWVDLASEFCVADIKRQGIMDETWTSFDYHNIGSVSLTPAGINFYPPSSSNNELEVVVPYEKLKEHLKPDGPHRLFQTKVSE